VAKIICVVVFTGNSQVEKPMWWHSDSRHYSAAGRFY